MNTKLFAVILCCLVLLPIVGGGTTLYAQTPVHEAQSLLDGIVAQKCADANVNTTQEWIDLALTSSAGVSAEWYVLALRQQGKYDFTAYRSALEEYLASTQVYSASTRLKYAFVLAAVGGKDADIFAIMEDSIGQQGIMSWVFGLHLLSNGQTSASHTIEAVKEKLLSLQLANGGFALSGTVGDVDVTAMVLQALAPHYDTDPDVRDAVDRGVAFLSEKQLADGSYMSYGVKNPESGAQVLIALSALGIDGATDPRFIQNGNTILDGIAKFRLTDGTFSHTEGGAFNENATSQVMLAALAYLRMSAGKGSIYLIDAESDVPAPPTTSPVPPTTAPTPQTTEAAPLVTEPIPPSQMVDDFDLGYRFWAILIVLGLCAVTCILLLLLNKRNRKNFIAVAILGGLLILFFALTDFQSAEDYYDGKPSEKENTIGVVTLTIRCDAVVGKSDSEHIPSDGVLLQTVELPIEEGDTVYDILCDAAQIYKIRVDNRGSDTMAYIAGIGYLYEFDFGDLSGWVYRVNGESASVGCGEYVLSDGDRIEWHYSCDLGNDIQ